MSIEVIINGDMNTVIHGSQRHVCHTGLSEGRGGGACDMSWGGECTRSTC